MWSCAAIAPQLADQRETRARQRHAQGVEDHPPRCDRRVQRALA
jgi:hypothetical protein